MNRAATLSLVAASAVLAASAAILTAGPIDPPPGPVAPTYRTLLEVEPRTPINAANTPGDADSLYRITQPGSYYLTGNIQGVANKHGIEIAASGVTLDLNGFEMVGIPGMGAFDAINSLTLSATNITVTNGSIRGWGGDGIDVSIVGGLQACRVRDITSSGNAGRGIFISSGLVAGCTALSNTGVGIEVGAAGEVSQSASRGNVNGGFAAGDAVAFVDCAALQTTGIGFFTDAGCSFSRCVAQGNQGNGFFTGDGASIESCDASENAGNGFQVGDGSSVVSSTARQNSGSGVVIGNACTVADCTAMGNQVNGILVANRCHVRGNSCSGTGAAPVAGSAGIRVEGGDNRIERNSLTALNRGLDVNFSGNLIVANTASANTINWDISPTNFGQFVTAVNSGAAFAGSTGGAPLGNTDPWVNFSY